MKLPLPDGTVPKEGRIGEFRVEAQSIDHAEADYAAVMSCREHLGAWCADTWPEDGFTLEENRTDLLGHIKDAETGFGYGYTVFDPSDASVVGSVYLYPAAHFAESYDLDEETRKTMRESLLAVEYWLLPDIEGDDRHTAFLAGLRHWLKNDWKYTSAVWGSRLPMTARRTTYESCGFIKLAEAPALSNPDHIVVFHHLPTL